MFYLLIPYMAITARQSGGGLGAYRLPKFLPELLFAFGFGFAAYQYGGVIAALMATVWSYLWMQTGHGTVLAWGAPQYISDIQRSQFLTPFVDALADKFGANKTFGNPDDGMGHSIEYCRLFMAVKGFLIGLPVGGILFAVLWPLSYEIGARLRPYTKYSHNIAELLSGAFAGLSIVIFLSIIK